MDPQILNVISRQQPSRHRKLMLTVAKLLSRQDVDEIVYLSEDFVSPYERVRISSGVELMRCLERHNRLGPGNYHYILSSLREVGRLDVASTLAQSLHNSLPHLPPSLSISSQTHRLKLRLLGEKQTRYAQHMKKMSALSHDQLFWEEEWRDVFQIVCQDFVREDRNAPPRSADVGRVLPETLDDVTAGLLSFVSGLTALNNVEEFSTATRHFSDVVTSFEKLRSSVDGVRWKEHSGEYVGHVYLASEACSFLGEFLTDLLGEKTISAEAKFLSEALLMVGTTVSIDQRDIIISLLQWFFTATDVIVSSSLETKRYGSQLIRLLSCFAQEDIPKHNRELYMRILQGTRIANLLEVDSTFAGADPSSLAFPSILPSCPFLVILCLNTFILIHSSELDPGDWGRIKANYTLAESRLAQMYSVAAGTLFQTLQCVVDSFKRSILSIALEQATGLQEVITEVLS